MTIILALANFLGLMGMLLAGSKYAVRERAGWALAILSECAWVWWAVLDHQPTLIAWCIVWSMALGLNWWKWGAKRVG